MENAGLRKDSLVLEVMLSTLMFVKKNVETEDTCTMTNVMMETQTTTMAEIQTATWRWDGNALMDPLIMLPLAMNCVEITETEGGIHEMMEVWSMEMDVVPHESQNPDGDVQEVELKLVMLALNFVGMALMMEICPEMITIY